MLKKSLLLCVLTFIFSCSSKKSTEVTVIGTLHFPTKKINSDSIYNILKKINPDFILMEADSSIFNDEFSFKKTFDENEFNAVLKYLKLKPNINIRPIEFEGRNEYRKRVGIFPEAKAVFKSLNILSEKNIFTKNEQQIWDGFVKYWMLSDSINKGNLKTLNNTKADNIIDSLILYQYKKLKQITDNRQEFENSCLIDAKKDTITLKSYFQKWAKFEGKTRNNALASNSLNIIKNNPNAKIVILTGYKHRFYIRKYLKDNRERFNFNIKEFYKY